MNTKHIVAVSAVAVILAGVWVVRTFPLVPSFTTTGPGALGRVAPSEDMSRRLFRIPGPKRLAYAKKYDGYTGGQLRLSIPRAYINSVSIKRCTGKRMLDGLCGEIQSLGVRVSANTFRPYVTEVSRGVREYYEREGIARPKHVPHPRRYVPEEVKQTPEYQQQLRDHYKWARARRAMIAAVKARGFQEVNVSVGIAPDPQEKERQRLLASHLKHFSHRTVAENCTATPGPWPGSTRYDPATPPPLNSDEMRAGWKACMDGSYRSIKQKPPPVAYAWRDYKGRLTMVSKCGPTVPTCFAFSYWREIWSIQISFPRELLNDVPRMMKEAKALYEDFAAAAGK